MVAAHHIDCDTFLRYRCQEIIQKSHCIHSGTVPVIEDIAGKWWTIMQEDLGALGRMPNLQPVTWTDDGWLKVGNNGTPYESFVSKITKPKSEGDIRVKRLPTTDDFRSYPLGMQWQWNHKPDDEAWSLFERPGWLRLKTANVTATLPQTRNMLTQRIFAIKDKYTTGSVRLDVRHLTEGDRAGICILQDPYALIAAQRIDGKIQLIWLQDQVKDAGSSFKPAEKTLDVELTDSIVYLRASIMYGENKTKFYYSTDNRRWKSLGSETSQSFNLSVFVGARFGLFCQATKKKGGYADFDWFTTESEYNEEELCPATFSEPNENMYTATKLAVPTNQKTVETLIGERCIPVITATYADKHSEIVNSFTDFTAEDDSIVDFMNGQMIGTGQGKTKVTANYTDLYGNSFTTSFTAISSYFPLDYAHVRNNVVGTGTYKRNSNSGSFTFADTSNQMGWVYDNPVDMSGYRFLVVQLTAKQSAKAQVNLYISDKTSGACTSVPLATDATETVIDLSQATYTSKTSNGKPLATEKIRMVTFSAGVANKTLNIKEFFLTNDPKYDAIRDVSLRPSADAPVNVYTLHGQLLRQHVTPRQATQGLPAGIYVVGGRKVIVK